MTDSEQVPSAHPTIRFLDPAGAWAPTEAAEPFAEHAGIIDRDALETWYREMVEVRTLDALGTALQRQGQLALWVPSIGQEGAQIGSAHALAANDTVFPSYREHAVVMTRGVRFEEILAMLRGVAQSGWDAAATRVHPYAIVLASQIPQAVGYAMGVRLDEDARAAGDGVEPEAVAVYVGDGAMSEGDSSEALLFARSFDAPVLFFVQNNGWAISTPTAVQARSSFADRGAGFGIPSYRIDGNDAIAAYAVTSAALETVRSGAGPALIEAVTYRRGPHTSADDPTKYRTADDEASWAARDPVDRIAARLRALGAEDAFFEDARRRAETRAAEVRDAIGSIPDPTPDSMFAHVYSEPHPLVDRERAWYARYRAETSKDA